MKAAMLLVGHLAIYGGVALVAWPTMLAGAPFWAAVLAGLCIWISMVDFARYEVPDMGALLLVLSGAARLWLVPELAVADHLAGAVLWPVLVWGVAAGYARLRGWQGLGLGDVKLMAGIGIWTGFTGTIQVLMAASLAGILTLLVWAALRRVPLGELGTSAVAFGPFLCLSAWAVWLYGGT